MVTRGPGRGAKKPPGMFPGSSVVRRGHGASLNILFMARAFFPLFAHDRNRCVEPKGLRYGVMGIILPNRIGYPTSVWLILCNIGLMPIVWD